MTYPIPLLTFVDTAGLAEPLFCTFRMGGAWSKRLKEGDRVFLATKNEVVGEATVSSVTLGAAGDILREHAAMSHIELAMKAQQGRSYSARLAPARRFESIQKLYGPHRFGATTKLTAIMLLVKQ